MTNVLHHPSEPQGISPSHQIATNTPKLSNSKRNKSDKIPKRQPGGSRQFDSLQNLLEQAGYKETRIFTPVHKKTPPSPPETSASQAGAQRPHTIAIPIEESSMPAESSASTSSSYTLASDQKDGDEEYVNNLKAIAATSSWFQSSWIPSKQNKKEPALKKKQSEPAIHSLQRRSSAWSLWFGGSGKGIEQADEQVSPKERDVSPAPVSEPPLERPPLRHASSTKDLWQASMKHHRGKETGGRKVLHKCRSVSAKSMNDAPSPRRKQMMRQQSYDGARVVAGVGVRAASITSSTIDFVSSNSVFMRSEPRRVSLRQAFGEDAGDDLKSKEVQSPPAVEPQYISPTKKENRDSVSSFGDVEELSKESEVQETVVTPTEANTPLNLFSTVATPLVSRDDAVAMRNIGCLDFEAGRPDLISSKSDDVSTANRIRKMRSVDALEFALQRMQSAERTFGNSGIQRTAIPESSSIESFTQEDFANATSTDFDIPHAFEEVGNAIEQDEEAVPVRCLTPSLMITSPTGARPPQPLVLDGIEFEPRSISPKAAVQTISRPVPRRGGWKIIARTDSSENEQPKQSVPASEDSRGRATESKELNGDQIRRPTASRRGGVSRPKAIRPHGSKEHLQAPTLRKKAATKSCHNLGQSVRSDIHKIRAATGKLSGSEQVRALQRSVQRRERADVQYTEVIPSSPTEVDDDDPFSDFVALTQEIKSRSSSRSLRSMSESHSAQIDRSKMSPVPFNQKSRSPLGENRSESNSSSSDEPLRMAKSSISTHEKAKPASQITGGVGLACLVDLNQKNKTLIAKVIQPKVRQSSLANLSKNNFTSSKNENKITMDQHNTSFGMIGDENVNTLLDSPTARAGYRAIAKRRSTGNLR
ncbi:uncharacterized protein FA14DRAFT_157579 [Meira miltonrushii]|uniref:Uncharacterized protein n=1 Tax=Meira miltonrushii TaxID=1280837 RepID=A0A316V9K5_9BASI|nr:uncharacterized protein FA14DRAFT_157579 [Meira miltonrushii]PWN32883.1 hypothetical protein FA14DRAFT_157579 [Meira miltonrushii]